MKSGPFNGNMHDAVDVAAAQISEAGGVMTGFVLMVGFVDADAEGVAVVNTGPMMHALRLATSGVNYMVNRFRQ